MDHEDRIALFIDYENLALGARDSLGVAFDLKPIGDALAERGRVVVRRAYADWSYFDEDRRMLTRSHVELIEMPQRMGASRKNAADIKMAVDAIELAFVRDYISTFVVCTGDSDFTPLVHKLRELNKRVIGFGVRDSTSAMLPPACDEFLFYDNLEGVEPMPVANPAKGRSGKRGRATSAKPAAQEPATKEAPAAERNEAPSREAEAAESSVATVDVAVFVVQTVSGLQQSTGGAVTASVLKRTLLRKDPTFSESDHGFRAFGDLLEHLSNRGVIELATGPAKGDPEILLPETGGDSDAFALLGDVVAELGDTSMSGLKNRLQQRQPGFSEKKLGYGSFLSFCKAAQDQGRVEVQWSDSDDGYRLTAMP